MVARPSGLEDLGKVTPPPPWLLVLGSPAQASFLKVQPPRHLSRVLCPRLRLFWRQRVGGALGGEIIRYKPSGVCSATLHSNSQPGKPTFPKALVAQGTRGGREKVTFLFTTVWQVVVTGTSDLQGLAALDDSRPQETSWAGTAEIKRRNQIQTQVTCKNPTAPATFSLQPLRRKNKTKPPQDRMVSIPVTGKPIKTTRNQIPPVRTAIIESQQTINMGGSLEEREPPYTVSGMYLGNSHWTTVSECLKKTVKSTKPRIWHSHAWADVTRKP